MTAFLANFPTDQSLPGYFPPLIEKDALGFPSANMETMFLYEEGSGTTPADEMGGAAALIEHPNAVNNSVSYLSGGGGLLLAGTEIVTEPAFDAAAPWTIAEVFRIVDSVGADAEKIGGLMGFRNWINGASVRGPLVYLRGYTGDWDDVAADPWFAHRPPNGSGAAGTAAELSPRPGVGNVVGVDLICVQSFNGTDTITTTIRDMTGAPLYSGSLTVTEAQLFTISGTTVTSLQPMSGGPDTTYASTKKNLELRARYSVGSLTERAWEVFAAAADAKITARGR